MNIEFRYYLYTHTNIITNNVFYVGVGTKKYGDCDYGRAFSFSKKARNDTWHSVFKSCDRQIRVIIEREFKTKKECFNAEKKWIEKFGRKDKNKGLLVNKTDGGLSSTYDVKKIIQYDLFGRFIKIWNSVNEASSFYNIDPSAIYSSIRNNSKSVGHLWVNYTKNFECKINPYIHSKSYCILQMDLDFNVIRKYNSLKEASENTGINKRNIMHVVNKVRNRRTAGGYVWAREKGCLI